MAPRKKPKKADCRFRRRSDLVVLSSDRVYVVDSIYIDSVNLIVVFFLEQKTRTDHSFKAPS
jgi:hypothetical protein